MSDLSHKIILVYRNKQNNEVQCHYLISHDGIESSMIIIDNSIFEESSENDSAFFSRAMIDDQFYGYVNKLNKTNNSVETLPINESYSLEENIQILNELKNSQEFFDARMNLFMLKKKFLNFENFQYFGYDCHLFLETTFSKNGNHFTYSNYTKYYKDDYNFNTTRPVIKSYFEESFIINQNRLMKEHNLMLNYDYVRIRDNDSYYFMYESRYNHLSQENTLKPYIRNANKQEFILSPLKEFSQNRRPISTNDLLILKEKLKNDNISHYFNDYPLSVAPSK